MKLEPTTEEYSYINRMMINELDRNLMFMMKHVQFLEAKIKSMEEQNDK